MSSTPAQTKQITLWIVTIVVLLIIIGLIIAIIRAQQQASNKPVPLATTGASEGVLGYNASIYPDPKLTPGHIYRNITADDVCQSVYSSRVRNVPEIQKKQVSGQNQENRDLGTTKKT